MMMKLIENQSRLLFLKKCVAYPQDDFIFKILLLLSLKSILNTSKRATQRNLQTRPKIIKKITKSINKKENLPKKKYV
jgi:hypothetical protein